MTDVMRQVILYPDPDVGGWIAEVPSLPGCVSEGETKEEAIHNIRDAIEGWLSTAAEHGDLIPGDPLETQVVVIEVAPAMRHEQASRPLRAGDV